MSELSPRQLATTLVHFRVFPRDQALATLGKYEGEGKAVPFDRYLVEMGLATSDQCLRAQLLWDQGYYHCSACGYAFPRPQNQPPSSGPCPRCQSPLRYWSRLSSTATRMDQVGSGESTWAEDLPRLSGEGETPSQFRRGQVSRYEVIGKLGQGGFGRVLQVQDPLTKRKMALKILKGEGARKIQVKQRFLREVQITANLEHPNIMPVYESGYLRDGSLYFAMKELRGGTLKDVISEHTDRDRDYRSEVEILIEVCRALEYAHSRGIIHRDLKPSNIAVGDFGEVMVLDWGLAKAVGVEEPEIDHVEERQTDEVLEVEGESLTMGNMLGTPGYMAPEQARGEEATEASDIHALGAALYQVLAGEPPYQGTVANRLVQLLRTPPPEPVVAYPERKIPRELAAVAMKCLEKDPAHRYTSVADFRQDLTRYLEGFSVSAKRDWLGERMVKWIRRNKALAGAVATVVVAVMVTIALMWTWERQRRDEMVAGHLAAAQSILDGEGVVSTSVFEDKYREMYETPGRESVESRRKRQALIKEYMEARKELDRAYQLASTREDVRKKLFQVEEEIGRLALLGENYLLAKTSFSRCVRLDPDRGKDLLARGKKREQEREALYKKRAREIIEEMARVEISPGVVDERVTELVKMGTPEVVKVLLAQLDHKKVWPRMVAIEALGKIGDVHTSYRDRDVVDHLVRKLKALEVNAHPDEGKALVWALGRLRDERAYEVVFEKRFFEAKPQSNLSQSTKIPAQWIPTPDKWAKKWQKKLRKPDEEDVPELQLAAASDVLAGRFGAGLKKLNQLIEEEGHRTGETYFLRGNTYYHLKKYDRALRDINRAVRMEPSRADGYLVRGDIYIEKNNPSKALEDYNRAIDRNPKSEIYYCHRGMAYKSLGRPEKALADFNRCLSLNPKYAEGYSNRGYLYVSLNQWEKGRRDLEKALELDATRFRPHIHLGRIYMSRGKLERGLSHINRAVKLAPKTVEPYVARAAFYQKMKKHRLALQDLERALKINPSLSQLHYMRGITYVKLGDHKKVIEAFDKCLAHSPGKNRGKALLYRAFSHYRLKNYHKCIRDFKAVLEIQPTLHQIRFQLGLCYKHLGREQKTLEVWSDLIRRAPNYHKAYMYRGAEYFQQKKYDQGRADFRKYLEIAPPNDPHRRRIERYLRRKR